MRLVWYRKYCADGQGRWGRFFWYYSNVFFFPGDGPDFRGRYGIVKIGKGSGQEVSKFSDQFREKVSPDHRFWLANGSKPAGHLEPLKYGQQGGPIAGDLPGL